MFNKLPIRIPINWEAVWDSLTTSDAARAQTLLENYILGPQIQAPKKTLIPWFTKRPQTYNERLIAGYLHVESVENCLARIQRSDSIEIIFARLEEALASFNYFLRGYPLKDYLFENDELTKILMVIKKKTHFDYRLFSRVDVMDRYNSLGMSEHLNSTSSWTKQGDFTLLSNKKNGAPDHRARYVNMLASKINRIEIMSYEHGRVVLSVGTLNQDVLTQITVACSVAGLPKPQNCILNNNDLLQACVTPDNCNQGIREYTLSIKNQSAITKIECLLEIIVSVDSNTIDVVNQIYGLLGRYRTGEKQDLHALIIYAKNAQNKKDYATIWELVQTYREDYSLGKTTEASPINVLIDLYEAISEDSPHYKNAQFELVGLKSLAISDGQPDKVLLAELFKHAMNSGQQTLIDQLYHSMCGSLDFQPRITGINVNLETLIVIANEICQSNSRMNDKINLLQEQLDVMTKERNQPPDSLIHHVVTSSERGYFSFFSSSRQNSNLTILHNAALR